jgi:subtilase family serine protease
VKAPYSAAAGSTITVSDTTTNAGGASAPGSTTRFYLSLNLGYDAGDVALGSRSIGPLAAGASSAGSTSIVIPAGTTPGAYWLIAVTDADGGVTEASETNNTKVVFVRITAGG